MSVQPGSHIQIERAKRRVPIDHVFGDRSKQPAGRNQHKYAKPEAHSKCPLPGLVAHERASRT
jgi:hypothetical protein